MGGGRDRQTDSQTETQSGQKVLYYGLRQRAVVRHLPSVFLKRLETGFTKVFSGDL